MALVERLTPSRRGPINPILLQLFGPILPEPKSRRKHVLNHGLSQNEMIFTGLEEGMSGSSREV